MADYIFVYLKKGSHLDGTPWSGDLETAKIAARDGLLRRSADEVEIRSSTLSGPPLLWQTTLAVSAGQLATTYRTTADAEPYTGMFKVQTTPLR